MTKTQPAIHFWNRSSALSPEQTGIINTAVALVMARAAELKEENSLTDELAREFYAMVNASVDAKIDEYLKELKSKAQ
jgi:hypothetical protein